jgi:transcription elongation GreA/GreB family factor
MALQMVASEFDRLKLFVDKVREQHQALLAKMGPTHEEGGGWHDNSAFDALKADERRVGKYLKELEDFLLDCEVLPRRDVYEVVELGCIVTVCVTRAGRTIRDRLIIAGNTRPPLNLDMEGLLPPDEEEGPYAVSFGSPVALALMGAKVGDSRETKAGDPPKTVRYEVLQVA